MEDSLGVLLGAMQKSTKAAFPSEVKVKFIEDFSGKLGTFQKHLAPKANHKKSQDATARFNIDSYQTNEQHTASSSAQSDDNEVNLNLESSTLHASDKNQNASRTIKEGSEQINHKGIKKLLVTDAIDDNSALEDLDFTDTIAVPIEEQKSTIIEDHYFHKSNGTIDSSVISYDVKVDAERVMDMQFPLEQVDQTQEVNAQNIQGAKDDGVTSAFQATQELLPSSAIENDIIKTEQASILQNEEFIQRANHDQINIDYGRNSNQEHQVNVNLVNKSDVDVDLVNRDIKVEIDLATNELDLTRNSEQESLNPVGNSQNIPNEKNAKLPNYQNVESHSLNSSAIEGSELGRDVSQQDLLNEEQQANTQQEFELQKQLVPSQNFGMNTDRKDSAITNVIFDKSSPLDLHSQILESVRAEITTYSTSYNSSARIIIVQTNPSDLGPITIQIKYDAGQQSTNSNHNSNIEQTKDNVVAIEIAAKHSKTLDLLKSEIKGLHEEVKSVLKTQGDSKTSLELTLKQRDDMPNHEQGQNDQKNEFDRVQYLKQVSRNANQEDIESPEGTNNQSTNGSNATILNGYILSIKV
ncbi:MAG: hypothetical protein AB8B67_00790 [Rickettsiaceae bacterium]